MAVKEEKTSFTIDSDATSNTMPSVSKLLNRKRFERSKASEPLPAHIPEGISIGQEPAFNIQPPPPAPEPAQGSTVVRPAAAASGDRRGQARIIVWTRDQLRSGGDPMGKALDQVLGQGALHAVFMAIHAVGGQTPVFKASAAVTLERVRLGLWTGLAWDPKLIPELWAHFVRTGWLEFPPAGTSTQVQSTRNVLRAAFGVKPEEWLTLIRVGPIQACRGVVAVLSTGTLAAAVSATLPQFHAPIRSGTG